MLINLVKGLLPRRKILYDGRFFKDQWFSNWKVLEPILSSLIIELPQWKSILDFGCGPGVMIDPMIAKGFSYLGCDYSQEARQLYLTHYGKNPQSFVSNLTDVDMKKIDLFLSFDVFEHMTDSEISNVLNATRPIKDYFLNISRDIRTSGHINIKSDRAWINFFKERGLFFNEELSERLRCHYEYLRPSSPDKWDKNIFIFKRCELQP